MALDSKITDSARSISSSAHSLGKLLDLKLLVYTWILISARSLCLALCIPGMWLS